jgi:hypothetical protein
MTRSSRRWRTAIFWIAVLVPVPYGSSRLLWAAGVPIGIDEAFLRELHSPGWGSLGLVALALLSEGTAVFTRVFLAPDGVRVVPAWVPVAGGRRIRPWLVVAPLLAPIAILALANAFTVGLVVDDGFTMPAGNDGLPAWSFWGQLAIFWIWGASLTAATFLYWRETRRPAHPSALPGRATAR